MAKKPKASTQDRPGNPNLEAMIMPGWLHGIRAELAATPAKSPQRKEDLRRAEKELQTVEAELAADVGSISRLFGAALRLGVYSERAKARIPSSRPSGGRPPKLTADDVIQIRLKRGKKRSVPDLASDYGVSDDIIYNVLNGKYVPKK